MKKKIRQIFITGLVVTIPIGFTLYVFFFLIGIMDNVLSVIPEKYRPDILFGFHIPGLGVLATITIVFLSGLLAKSYIGDRIVRFGEYLFNNIPVVRSVYVGTKRVVDSVLISNRQNFKKVVLIEFPRPGVYAVALVMGDAPKQVVESLGKPSVSVFVPTTPNPTSGYLVIVPVDELKEIDMGIEDAITFIISCGIVFPTEKKPELTSPRFTV
ncbi:MAG: DUF502 domain-containing protein [Syntrophales bacterium]|nr:DUF502 domain-containing protein [Syntrophales bacterium]